MQATVRIRDSVHDFDFLIGSWTVANRRLKRRFVGSSDWDQFPARLTVRYILGGIGNTDEIAFPTQGWTGATLRLFNPVTKQWSLYWADSRRGVLFPPVVGSFDGERGVFYGDDVDDGKPIRVRYLWSGITSRSARWEQAFSLDTEKTWETNWIMEITRSEP